MFRRLWFGSYECKWEVDWKRKKDFFFFIQLMTISWLSAAAFLKFLYQKIERVFGWGWQGWSSENAVPQKLFHIKRSSLSSCPCTEGADPTVHRLPSPQCISVMPERRKSRGGSGQEATDTCKVVLLWERKAV